MSQINFFLVFGSVAGRGFHKVRVFKEKGPSRIEGLGTFSRTEEGNFRIFALSRLQPISDPYPQQFTYGVVSEGVFCEKFAEILRQIRGNVQKTRFVASVN